MTGIDGNTDFAPHLYRHFSGSVPGAVLLFRYNIADSPEAVYNYLTACQRAFSSLGGAVPVLFAIDHEGGDVYRTGKLTTRLPAAREVADRFSPAEAASLYKNSGAQLFMLGIRMNLAPVAETAAPPSFTLRRTYSADPADAASYAGSALAGYRSAGLLTTLKHFPGNSPFDPHLSLPVLDVSEREFSQTYLFPFKRLLKKDPDAVLVSSVIVPLIDPDNPVSLSVRGVQGLLRDKLGFQGLVLTDDLSMSAIRQSGYTSEQAAVAALAAGCDMIMTSAPDIRSIVQAIMDEAAADENFAKRLDQAVMRILVSKARAGLLLRKRTAALDGGFDTAGYHIIKVAGDALLERSTADE